MFRIRTLSLVTLSASSLLVLACGDSDRPKTSSAGSSTPTVTAISTDSSSETGSPTTAVTPVSYNEAEAAFKEKRYAEAAQLFTGYSESRPENPWGHYMLGLSAWKSGNHQQASSAFDRALELEPDHLKSLLNSSRVLLEMGEPRKALERVEKALAIDSTSNEASRLLGRVHYAMGQTERAIEAYRHALALNPKDVWSMNNLAVIYIDQERSTEALPPLARAVQLKEGSPVFQNNLGTALERAGYPEAAAKAYEAAIAADSSYQKASVSLARVTAAGKPSETVPVDLAALAQEFEAEIESWDAVAEDVESTKSEITGLSDSSRASVEMVDDSLMSETVE